MKYIISRFNHDLDWLKEYTNDYVIYDRSLEPIKESIVVPNLGSDISDKFSFIIDNYNYLPNIAVYTKANLFKYITRKEFDQMKNNNTFTALLTRNHKTYMPICWYENGLYCEINNYWYLNSHPAKYAQEIIKFFKMNERKYNTFAPGSNYILRKENILKHPRETYVKLKSYLDWDIYPGDAQLMERNLWYLWK